MQFRLTQPKQDPFAKAYAHRWQDKVLGSECRHPWYAMARDENREDGPWLIDRRGWTLRQRAHAGKVSKASTAFWPRAMRSVHAAPSNGTSVHFLAGAAMCASFDGCSSCPGHERVDAVASWPLQTSERSYQTAGAGRAASWSVASDRRSDRGSGRLSRRRRVRA
jgi:hypothetical protein